MRPRPVTVPAAAARSASASAARSSSASACSTSTSAGSVRRTPRPARSSSAHAGLALEHRELLRDGRRRELERVGDGGDRAALVAARAAAAGGGGRASCSNATEFRSEIGMDPDGSIGQDARSCAPPGPSSASPPAPPSARWPIFGKLAYDEGATVGTLLAVRFVLAAALFWVLVARRRGARLRSGRCRGATSPSALALGACGYALQAGCYFAALERIDASLLVAACSTRSRRSSPPPRSRSGASGWTRGALVALALASGGLALVVAGAGAGALDPLGVALGARRGARLQHVHPRQRRRSSGACGRSVLSALVCTGAAVSLTARLGAARRAAPGRADASPAGAGSRASPSSRPSARSASSSPACARVGPTTASILATVEPLVTVVLAFLVFGETLGPVQLVGGALVLAAVLVLNLRRPRRIAVREATA